MKHYVLKGLGSRANLKVPSWFTLLFEVKIDIQDVRSGYRNSRHQYFEAAWLEDPDLSWTPDLVREIPAEQLEEVPPPAQPEWPRFGDQKIIHYLMQHQGPRVWRNRELEMYASAQETEAEFIERCREQLDEERRRELKKIKDVLLHRFLELEQKVIHALEQMEDGTKEWNSDLRNHKISSVRSLFSTVREDLGRWFLRSDYRPLSKSDLEWRGDIPVEFLEKLLDLRGELISKYNQIGAFYEQKARAVETYEVPLSYAKIDIVSRGILWK